MAGGFVWWRRRDLTTSGLIAGIGIGSVAFHGPMPPWGEFLHDISILLTLVWVLLVEIGRRHWWPFGVALAAALAVAPTTADPAQAVLALGAIAALVAVPEKRRLRLTVVAILGMGALVGTLSRTGGPLCDAASIWQGHGLWHLTAAAVLAVWGAANLATESRL